MLLLAAYNQVEKTQEVTAAAVSKATNVEGQARAVTNAAKSTEKIAERREEALTKATKMAGAVDAAGEKAQSSFR